MPSNHLILCRPLLLLPSIFLSIRVFSIESALRIGWPNYWSFSLNMSPSNEHPGLISFRMDWLNILVVQGILRIFSNITVQKYQFFSAQLSSEANSHIHTWPQDKLFHKAQTFVSIACFHSQRNKKSQHREWHLFCWRFIEMSWSDLCGQRTPVPRSLQKSTLLLPHLAFKNALLKPFREFGVFWDKIHLPSCMAPQYTQMQSWKRYSYAKGEAGGRG